MISETSAGRFLCLPGGVLLRFPRGMWEYRRAEDADEQATLRMLGWTQVGPCLFKLTHREP